MKFNFSGNLLRFVDHHDAIEVDATDMAIAMQKLVEKYPEVKKVIFDQESHLRGVHQFFFNGELVPKSEVLHHPVGKNDEVAILTPIAGG